MLSFVWTKALHVEIDNIDYLTVYQTPASINLGDADS